METFKFLMPIHLIPSFKKAARDMSVEVTYASLSKDHKEYYAVEVLSSGGPFDLISIGRLMATDAALYAIGDTIDKKKDNL